ncbi:jg12246 [Pararge aegeria aegeria]|uniref:Macoilin n=1 Tax=Pararge aegeria aegeria TaxID=348720 RepID=A0A8S4S310_9NEOP|nr:jg12246 [Pararge aegeria aegeria]
MRRPIKRTKITEGIYGNTVLYLKFVMLWVAVVMVDYMLEFRFEYLWPFWMMLRSIYDSFKYHGVAFSIFFIFIAFMSDLICYFFIPLQYIFFSASTYVWVQYVWYTSRLAYAGDKISKISPDKVMSRCLNADCDDNCDDDGVDDFNDVCDMSWSPVADKGVCMPTVALCCLVVYTEGALRARTGPLELWRPLAAHCLGYPTLSLGFGVKAYVGQRLRLRRQRQVRAENEFYFQLLRDALPESALEQYNNVLAEGGVEEAMTLQRVRDVCGVDDFYAIIRKRASMMNRLVSSTNTLLSTLACRLGCSLWGAGMVCTRAIGVAQLDYKEFCV